MKPSKLFLFLAIIILSLNAFGQENTSQTISPKAKEMAKKSDEIMQESLSLTKDQIPAISKINTEFSQKMVTLFEKPGSKFGKMGDVKKINKDRKAALEKVLTKDQMKLFEKKVASKMRKEMKKIMQKDS